MIKFMATNPINGRKIFGMFLSEGNVSKLKEGMPIHFNAEELKLDNISCNEILIGWFKTEAEGIEKLKEYGYIDDSTKITQDSTKQ